MYRQTGFNGTSGNNLSLGVLSTVPPEAEESESADHQMGATAKPQHSTIFATDTEQSLHSLVRTENFEATRNSLHLLLRIAQSGLRWRGICRFISGNPKRRVE